MRSKMLPRRAAGVAATGMLLAFLGRLPAHAQAARVDPDEGTFASVKPRIPEPMVFDLIRPLGAERGEFEVNSLFGYSPTRRRPQRLNWAPEIEYAFLEGYGIEFELPMQNARIETWKGAIQGTLPGPRKKRFIQGWQALGETERHGPWRLDLMYLAGSRWHKNWSAFSMTGVERESGPRHAHAFLGNYTLFYHLRDTVSYGFETNFKGRGNSGRSTLLMPQIQLRKNRLNVQVGAGWGWFPGQSGLQIGWRLSREF